MGDVKMGRVAVVAIALAGCELITSTPPAGVDAGVGGGGNGSSTSSMSAAGGGGGAHVECFVPIDCAGEDTDCTVRACIQGVCGKVELPLGTPTKNQAAGDCQRAVCDGKGQEISIIDGDDLPIDADPCTDDVCTASIPSNPPSGAGKPCAIAGGAVCDGLGSCVECVAAVDCPLGLACVDNVCM